jgi:hypothetical protein
MSKMLAKVWLAFSHKEKVGMKDLHKKQKAYLTTRPNPLPAAEGINFEASC